MKISDLVKQLLDIKEIEGDLNITNSSYDIKNEPWIYVSKAEEGEEDQLGTFLVIEG